MKTCPFLIGFYLNEEKKMIKILLLYFFCFSSFASNKQNLDIAEPELSPHEAEKQCVIDLALVCVRYYRYCRELYKMHENSNYKFT